MEVVQFVDGILTVTLSERTSGGGLYGCRRVGRQVRCRTGFSGTPPANVALGSGGVLSVSPSFGAVQVVSMTVEAADAYSSAVQTVVLDVVSGVTLSSLDTITMHQSHRGAVATMQASPDGGSYRYALNALIPAGSAVVIDGNSGVVEINGALQVGSVSLQVGVTDGFGDTASISLTIRVLPDITLGNTRLTVGAQYSGAVVTVSNAQGGDGAYSYRLLSSPSALSAAGGSGALTLSAASALGANVVVTAIVEVVDGVVFGTVAQAEVIITTWPALSGGSALLTVVNNAAYRNAALYTVNVSGGAGTYNYVSTASIAVNSAGIISDAGLIAEDAEGSTVTALINIIDSGGDTATYTLALDVLSTISWQSSDSITLLQTDSQRGIYTLAVASGGSGDYTYRVLSTAPSSNLAANAVIINTARVVSLSAQPAVGVVAVAIEADDGFTRATADLALQVSAQLVFSPSSANRIVHSAHTGSIYNASASLGLPPYSYALAGALPTSAATRVAVSAAGEVSLPQALGAEQSMSIYITASDGFGSTATLTLLIDTVEAVQFADGIITVTLSERTNGAVYTVRADGAAGAPVYRFSGTPAAANIALGSGGLLSVSPSFGAVQVVSMTVEAVDDYSSAVQTVVLDVVSGVTLSSLDTITMHQGYRGAVATVVASLGGGSYRYALNALTPSGSAVVIDGSGVVEINGILQVGSVSLQIEVTDNLGDTASISLTIQVLPDITLDNTRLTVGAQYTGAIVTVSNAQGGDGAYRYELLSAPVALSAAGGGGALTLSADSALGGNAVVTATVEVVDDVVFGAAVQAEVIITTWPALSGAGGGALLTVVNNATYISAALYTVNVSGGAGTYNYASTASVAVNSAGIISDAGLIADDAEGSTVTALIDISDSGGDTATYTIAVHVLSTISWQSSDSVTLLQTDSQRGIYTLSAASGGSGDYIYRVLSTAPSSNLATNAVTITERVVSLSAQPAAGVVAVAIEADDSFTRATVALGLQVSAQLELLPSRASLIVHSARTGSIYTASASLGLPPYRYTLAGALPTSAAALVNVSAAGEVSLPQVLAAEQSMSLYIAASDGFGSVATLILHIDTVEAVQFADGIVTVTLSERTSGAVYTVQAGGGAAGALSYHFSGTPAANVSLNNGGLLSLTSSFGAAQVVSMTVEAADAYSSAVQTVVLDVLSAVTLSSLNTISVHQSYRGTVAAVSASLGGGGYRYALSELAPADSAVVIDSSSGAVEITSALQVGSVSLQIEVTDRLGDTANLPLAIRVLPDVTLDALTVTVSHTKSGHLVTINHAGGGDGSYHYQMVTVDDSRLTAQAVPNGLIISISAVIGVTQTITAQISVTDGIAQANATHVGGMAQAHFVIRTTPANISVIGLITLTVVQPYAISTGLYTIRATADAPVPLSFELVELRNASGGTLDVDLMTLVQSADSAVLTDINSIEEVTPTSSTLPDIAAVSHITGGGSREFISVYIKVVSTVELAAPPLLILVQNRIRVSNLITLTASGGRGAVSGVGLSAYSYQLLSSAPVAAVANVQMAGDVVQLTQAYGSDSNFITLWVEASDNYSRHTAVLSMQVLPALSIQSPISLTLSNRRSGVIITLSVSGGLPPYRYTVANTIPEVFELSESGVLALTATIAPQTVTVHSTVDDAAALVVQQTLDINILPHMRFSNASELITVVKHLVGRTVFVAQATLGLPAYQYDIVQIQPPAASAAFSLSAQGALRYTEERGVGINRIHIRATDSFQETATLALQIQIVNSTSGDDVYGSGTLYVYGGYNNTALNDRWDDIWAYSGTNGDYSTGWTRLDTTSTVSLENARFNMITFNGYLYILGGDSQATHGRVLRSHNGMDWHEIANDVSILERTGSRSAVFNREILVMGSTDAQSTEIWTSIDGVIWEEKIQTPGRAVPDVENGLLLVDDNRLFLIGGTRTNLSESSPAAQVHEIWMSADAQSWEQIIPASGALTVGGFADGAVFHEALHIVGGFDGTNLLRMINSSGNLGINWSSRQPPFGGLAGHQVVSYNDDILVMGGGLNPLSQEIWHSKDMTHWQRTVALWGARTQFQAVVLDNDRPPPPGLVPDIIATLATVQGEFLIGNTGLAARVSARGGYTVGTGYTYTLISGGDYFTVDTDGNISLTAVLWQRAALTAQIAVDDNYLDSDPAYLDLTVNVSYALTFAPSAATIDFYENLNTPLYTLQATLGAVPYTYTLSSLVAPSGLTLSVTVSADGVLYVPASPTDEGTLTVYSAVNDTEGTQAIHTLQVNVTKPPRYNPDYIQLTISVRATGTIYSPRVERGIPPYQHTLVSTVPLRPQVTINTDGEIILTSSLAVVQDVQVVLQVFDSRAYSGYLTVQVAARAHGSPNVQSGGSVYIIGGVDENDNALADVWVSAVDDMITYERLTESAAFGARYGHRVAVFDGHMYLTGGRNGAVFMNDVWRSSDGENWELVTANAAWGARSEHLLLVHQNRMLVIGGAGANDDGAWDDVWSSSNGIAWTRIAEGELSGHIPGVGLHEMSGAVVGDDILISGGRGGNEEFHPYHYLRSADGVNWQSGSAAVTGSGGGLAAYLDRYYYISGEISNSRQNISVLGNSLYSYQFMSGGITNLGHPPWSNNAARAQFQFLSGRRFLNNDGRWSRQHYFQRRYIL